MSIEQPRWRRKIDHAWKVTVSYPMNLYSTKFDRAIERVAGMVSTASGAGFGERDLEWDSLEYNEARKMTSRLKSIKELISISYEKYERFYDF